MGLDVRVDVDGESTFSFSAGGYIGYAAFTDALTRAIRGRAAAEARAKGRMMSMMTGMFGSMDPVRRAKLSKEYDKMHGGSAGSALPSRIVRKDEGEMGKTLDLFLNHADDSGEFTHEECIKLYKLFKENRTRFQGTCGSPSFRSLYDSFMKAFKLARNAEDGKVVYH